jgi:hypothetical protein
MENSHNFTLNEAAKETGRSKGTISKALNNGKLSYISKTKSGYQIEPEELFRVFPLKQDKSRNQVHLPINQNRHIVAICCRTGLLKTFNHPHLE